MRKFLFAIIACGMVFGTCACNQENTKPDDDPTDEPKPFVLDSWNGDFAKGIADAYDVFESTGALPTMINVQGIKYHKGKYTLAACLLLQKIDAEPDTWQNEDIDLTSAAYSDLEYRYNTFDPDIIDMPHIRFLASAILDYNKTNNGLPNYVTFPSDDPAKPGYLPKITMVVTKHDNMMNLRAYTVVFARLFNYFVKNGGKWPEEGVSSWPSSYLAATRNCPITDPVVIATRDAALKGLPETATARQKAEAIYKYARDEWEWEDYSNTKKGAVKTINEKGGNCCDLTHATLAMCRATGIPARYLHGKCNYSTPLGHVIPEIYVDGKWWIADPSNNKAVWGTPTWNGMETFHGRYYELEF